MIHLYKNKEKAYKKLVATPNPPFLIPIGWWAGVSGSQNRKPNFAIIYRKLRDLGAKIDCTIFFRDYAKLLAKQEVIFILDDLNRAFFINTKTGEVIKGEVTGILRFRFHLGESDFFDLNLGGDA